jgi:hypothetical protein
MNRTHSMVQPSLLRWRRLQQPAETVDFRGKISGALFDKGYKPGEAETIYHPLHDFPAHRRMEVPSRSHGFASVATGAVRRHPPR